MNGTDDELYFSNVRIIVNQHCIRCHFQGGQGMPVILTSDTDIVNQAEGIKSAVIDPATWLNKRMPPDGELTESEKACIQNWYDAGGQLDD